MKTLITQKCWTFSKNICKNKPV